MLRSAQVENSKKGDQDEVKELKEKLDEAASEQEDLLVMLAEQEEKMGNMRAVCCSSDSMASTLLSFASS